MLEILWLQIINTRIEYYIPLVIVLGFGIWQGSQAVTQYRKNKTLLVVLDKAIEKRKQIGLKPQMVATILDSFKKTKTFLSDQLLTYIEKEELQSHLSTTKSSSEYLLPNDFVSGKNGSNPFVALKVVPGLLVGAGILGTFLGLSMGLEGLGNIAGSEVETLIERVDQLVGGISAAFITSILGMLFSILSSMALSWFQKEISTKYTRLVTLLDSEFLIADKVWLEKLLSFTIPGTSKSKSISEGVADLVVAQEHTVPILEGMAEKIAESIGDRIDSFATEMFSTLQGNAGEAVKEGALKARETFDSLVDNLVQVADQLNPLIGDLSTTLKANIEDMFKLIHQFDISLKLYNNQNENLEQTISNISVVDQSFQTILGSFDNAVQQISGVQDGLKQVAEASVQSLDHASEKWNKVSDHVTGVLTHLTDLQEEYNSVNESISSIFTQVNSGVLEYQEAIGSGTERQLKQYHDAIIDFSNRLASAATNIEEGIEQLNQTIESIKRTDLEEELQLVGKES